MLTNESPTLDGRWYTPVHTTNPQDGLQLVVLARNPVSDPGGLQRRLNEQLDMIGSGYRVALEDGCTQPTVTPFVVSYPEVVAQRPIAGASSLLEMFMQRGVSVSVSADPVLVGAPAYKPSALTRGDFGRVPVTMLAQGPPRRRPLADVPGGRRPVVALLDTAVEQHPWLEPDPERPDDDFWIDARHKGWLPGPRLTEGSSPPGARELGDQEGHGTFCAGLVRQVAPDARVLAVHVIRDDGRVYGDHVLNALGWLNSLDGANALVEDDVVCLPVGFQPNWPTDSTYLTWLGGVLGQLGERGVRVVAAAGNDGEAYPTYPAAFAVASNPPSRPLVSVGAFNTNGRTYAEFSNHGEWVTEWEVGTSVVSTFPAVNGAARSELVFEGDRFGARRESADPDDFTGGFARWSGTSFAAAIHAGKCAQRLVGPPLDAIDVGPA
jgi:hypothetical protein